MTVGTFFSTFSDFSSIFKPDTTPLFHQAIRAFIVGSYNLIRVGSKSHFVLRSSMITSM